MCFYGGKGLPNNKIWGLTDLKAFTDDISNVVQMMICVNDWEFSPFPPVFSRGFFFKVVKSWDCVVKS